MSELPFGRYKIIAVAAGGNRFAGVDPNRPTDLPVRVDAPVNIWEVKPQPEPGFYRLSLVDAFPYTGVEDGRVIATFDEERDINWLIKYHRELEGYSIAERAIWPTPAWSLSSDEPNAEIKIKLYELYPGKDQLFTFERLYE